jgi:hypothetical protein
MTTLKAELRRFVKAMGFFDDALAAVEPEGCGVEVDLSKLEAFLKFSFDFGKATLNAESSITESTGKLDVDSNSMVRTVSPGNPTFQYQANCDQLSDQPA